MNEFETNILAQLTKIEQHLDFIARYMMDINLVFTTILAKQLDLEQDTINALTREVRRQVIDIFLSSAKEP